MNAVAQVKAAIPRELKRRVFAAFALREEKFNRWLRTQMEAYVQQIEGEERNTNDERLAGSETRG